MDSLDVLRTVERWAAVRVGARWEKMVAERLAAAGVPTYLPLMSRTTKYKGKRQTFEVPVFSGYVFCSEEAFLGNSRASAACAGKIAQFLRPGDPDRLREDLLRTATLLTGRRLVEEKFHGQVGDTVRLIGGAFRGQEGEIVGLKPGQNRVVLQISFLGLAVEAVVDEALVKLEPARGGKDPPGPV